MKKIPTGKKADKKKVAAKNKSSARAKPVIAKKTVAAKQQDVPVFQPDLLKNDLVRQTIITVLWRNEEATIPLLIQELKKEIGHHFDGDIELYIERVKNDLEIRKLMEQSPGKKPVHYRLAQKLDKTDDDE